MSVLIVTNNTFLFSKPSQTCFTPAPLSKTQRLSARSILWLTSNPPYITPFFNSFFGRGRGETRISKQILYNTNNRATAVCYLPVGSVFDVKKIPVQAISQHDKIHAQDMKVRKNSCSRKLPIQPPPSPHPSIKEITQ